MKRFLLVVGFMMYLCQSAQAGEVVVALAGAKGTMKEFHDQISKVCSQPALVERQSPNGSVGVLNDLLNNEATVGFVLEDVLFARKMVENDPDVDNLKTLVNLYPSEVHIVTLANSPVRLFTDLWEQTSRCRRWCSKDLSDPRCSYWHPLLTNIDCQHRRPARADAR